MVVVVRFVMAAEMVAALWEGRGVEYGGGGVAGAGKRGADDGVGEGIAGHVRRDLAEGLGLVGGGG